MSLCVLQGRQETHSRAGVLGQEADYSAAPGVAGGCAGVPDMPRAGVADAGAGYDHSVGRPQTAGRGRQVVRRRDHCPPPLPMFRLAILAQGRAQGSPGGMVPFSGRTNLWQGSSTGALHDI